MKRPVVGQALAEDEGVAQEEIGVGAGRGFQSIQAEGFSGEQFIRYSKGEKMLFLKQMLH